MEPRLTNIYVYIPKHNMLMVKHRYCQIIIFENSCIHATGAEQRQHLYGAGKDFPRLWVPSVRENCEIDLSVIHVYLSIFIYSTCPSILWVQYPDSLSLSLSVSFSLSQTLVLTLVISPPPVGGGDYRFAPWVSVRPSVRPSVHWDPVCLWTVFRKNSSTDFDETWWGD